MKDSIAIALALIAGMYYSQTGCTSDACLKGMPSCIEITPPPIHITGEKTALERQIIGEYREIEKDAWVTSTVMVPSHGERYAQMSIDDEMMQAIQIRQLNSDKIAIYKSMGILGEKNDGYIAIVDELKLNIMNDAEIIKNLVKSENQARKLIFIKSSGALQSSDDKVSAFAREFAKEQQAKAKKGDWIQNNDGKWVKK